MDIQKWLDTFFTAWKGYDIDTVLSLFTDGVKYWETPFLRIPDKNALREVWQYILTQTDITLSYDVVAIQSNHYTILWQLQYMNELGQQKNFAGIYLIELDTDGKCIYFFQCGEQKL